MTDWENNLEIMFSPNTIAVVGASRRDGSIGKAILKNILDFNFEGTVYPVNPKAKAVNSIKAYPTLKDIPEPIDLVIVVVPSKYVMSVIEEAADLGVKACVIISAGFKEVNEEGARQERKMAAIAKAVNMRLVGPNCMGILHGHGTHFNGTFAPRAPLSGKIGFISQSGALGVVVIDYATQLGVGFSKFISLGNKADVNATDMIANLRDDPNTDVILAYLESFSDPWNFSEVARETSKTKPILMVKSGRTAAGAKAASSHTGALASSETALEASLSTAGIIRVTSVEELFDCAIAFSKCDLPKGDKVCIVTNAGGPATLTVDALIGQGLKLAKLKEETKEKMKTYLPEEAAIDNPIDMIASGGPVEFEKTLDLIINDDNVDSIIAIFVPPVMANVLKIAKVIDAATLKTDKPILGCIMGRNDLIEQYIEEDDEGSFPMYQFPESAVLALKSLTLYANWRKQPDPVIENLVDPEEKIKEIVPKAVINGQNNLTQEQVKDLFEGYGFSFPQTFIVDDLEEGLKAIDELEFPIVMKMASIKVEHKTDEGGVFLDIRSMEEALEAWKRITQAYDRLKVPKKHRQVTVQKFYSGGVEMALGISLDEQFGPMIMIGSGGILIEVLDDVAWGQVPLSREKAHSMIRKLKGYPLLLGYRGDNPVDIKALENAVLRLSQMASENRQIKELDINPLLALEIGHEPVILDARITLVSNQN